MRLTMEGHKRLLVAVPPLVEEWLQSVESEGLFSYSMLFPARHGSGVRIQYPKHRRLNLFHLAGCIAAQSIQGILKVHP